MTETKETERILNRLGRHVYSDGTDYWSITVKKSDFIMVRREIGSELFRLCRSYGKPYTERMRGFGTLEELAERYPELLPKLAEPIK